MLPILKKIELWRNIIITDRQLYDKIYDIVNENIQWQERYKADKISNNPFIIAFEEARFLQQHYYDKFCLNGRLETKDTEISSMFTSSSKKMLNDWLEAEEEYGDTIY